MRKKVEETIQPWQPALIVTYGHTTRKSRPLDRDVLVVGRAPGCDLGLVSPEVAPIHCLIVRLADGWHIRDCTGRGATRVNGRAVHEDVLRDGDTLQIGTFSFSVQLPSERTPPVPSPHVTPAAPAPGAGAVDRLQRSRRKLARLALALRRRLRRLRLGHGAPRAADDKGLAARQQELERQAEALWGVKRDYESRMARLGQAERETCAARAALQKRLGQAERDLAQCQAEAEARVREAWQQIQENARQAEQAPPLGHGLLTVPPAPAPPERTADAEALRETARRLELRARELDCYAAYLRRSGQDQQGRQRAEPCEQPRKEAEPPRAEAAPAGEQPAPVAEEPRAPDQLDVGRLREKARGQRSGNLQDRLDRIQQLKDGLTGGSAPGNASKPSITVNGAEDPEAS